MKKFLFTCLFLCAAALMAEPALYQLLTLPSGSAPTIDGTADEWPESYFIDTLDSDDNVYYRTSTTPWTAANYQIRVYGAHDAAKIYFAVKVITDDVNTMCGTQDKWSACDNIKINPGGKAVAFYVWANGTSFRNPSCPYVVGTSLWLGGNPTGSGAFPSYEFAVDKMVADPFGMGTMQLSVGSEDNDGNSELFAAVGAEYLGPKQDDASNPWDNPTSYPTFNMSTTEGSPVAVENGTLLVKNGCSLAASPNPFKPATTLSYNTDLKSEIIVYSVAGKAVQSFAVNAGAGKVNWDGKDRSGRLLSSGVYIAAIENGKNSRTLKLFLAR